MEQIKIRRCDIHDIEIIRELSEITFRQTFANDNTPTDMSRYVKEHFNITRMKNELTDPHSLFYLAEQDDCPVAYMKLNINQAQTEPDYPRSLELQRIYVLKAYKLRNIGHLLLNKAIEICRQSHLGYIWLGVWEHNTAAIKFYEKQGFKFHSTHRFILGADVQTDYIMKLTV